MSSVEGRTHGSRDGCGQWREEYIVVVRGVAGTQDLGFCNLW